MLERFVDMIMERRAFIAMLFAVCLGGALWILPRLPVDAFPDTSSVQVQVNAVAPALSGEEIEQQLALPIELAIGGLPGLDNVRSVSKFGLCQVTATFSDGTDLYDARQFILERLGTVTLPDGVDPPELGPISSGLGEVFAYLIDSTDPARSTEELRTLHDWVIKPELRKVAGVAEITAWGGYVRQYHVVASPEKLVEYGLTLSDVFTALERNNQNVGGGQVTTAGSAVLVHGRGRVHTVDQIAGIVVTARGGIPVRIHDIATVELGHEVRRGAVTASGEGESVLGLGYMLMGGNSRIVARALRAKLEEASEALPDDVFVRVVYDRTELVEKVLGTVRHNLFAGAVLVVVVLFLMLGSFRAGLLVAVTIPMAMLFAILGMYRMGIAASLLSLGAIDFGILVDGSVVMTDANLRSLTDRRRALGRPLTPRERMQAILSSSKDVVRPIVFGMGIILIVFFPVLSLEGTEGKMFGPMIWTFIFALAGALGIAVMLSPILSYYLLPRAGKVKEGRVMGWAASVYGGALRHALRWRGLVLAVLLVAGAATVVMALSLGGEFIPKLNEEAIVMNVVRLPGISLQESVEYNTRIEQLLLDGFPDEIAHIWSRTGTAEVATDPMGIELTDVFVTLHPRDQWTKADTQEALALRMNETLHGLPGQRIALTQPIELRMNELTSGIRSDVGLKIIGDDFDTLVALADDAQRIVNGIVGVADTSADLITGLPTLQVDVDTEAVARHGIPKADVLDFVAALGNIRVGDVFEGQRKFDLAVRLPDELRQDAGQLARTIVPTEAGARLTLGTLADMREVSGLANVNREWGRRVMRVQFNVRERDLMTVVREAQGRIAEDLDLPEGYLVEWSGQFEHLERSQRRLAIVVPLTLVLVFMLLYLSLGSLKDVLIVYTGVPFAAMGGVLALYWRGIPFSVSAAIGFVALSGIAVLDGQVMIAAIRSMRKQCASLTDAVVQAAQLRMRPVLATSITDALGFLPMALSMDVGAEVQRPLATVVVGGVVSSTLLTLLLLPLLYWMTARDVGQGDASSR
ncbi:MAG: efflux RND transporter permease subunit [bacterium]|nr:efflux RND transporter permease subunit [bacterium]